MALLGLSNLNSFGSSTPFGILFRQTKVVLGQNSEGNGNSLTGILSQTIGGVSGIVLDASISEDHVKECEVTENPVEEGAKITDHVQIKPAMLTIEGIISDYPIGFPIIGNVLNAASTVSNIFDQTSSRSIDAYNQLVKLMDDRQPFTVVTSLKKYESMVFESISVPRTVQSGRALHFTAKLKQIRIVSSQTGPSTTPKAGVKNIAKKASDKGSQLTKKAEDAADSKIPSLLSRVLN